MKTVFVILTVISFLVFTSLVGATFAQSSDSSFDDTDPEEQLSELQSQLKTAKQELKTQLDKNGIGSASLIKKINDVENKITEAVTNEIPSTCKSSFDSSLKRFDSIISLIEQKGCDQNQRIAFRGKCAKFLNDPVKFQQCEDKEHGKKPKKPKKPTMLISSSTMERGKCAKFLNDPVKFQQCEDKEHGNSGNGGTTPSPESKTKKCIPADTLDPIILEFQDISSELQSVETIDIDENGLPDFCDNNRRK